MWVRVSLCPSNTGTGAIATVPSAGRFVAGSSSVTGSRVPSTVNLLRPRATPEVSAGQQRAHQVLGQIVAGHDGEDKGDQQQRLLFEKTHREPPAEFSCRLHRLRLGRDNELKPPRRGGGLPNVASILPPEPGAWSLSPRGQRWDGVIRPLSRAPWTVWERRGSLL